MGFFTRKPSARDGLSAASIFVGSVAVGMFGPTTDAVRMFACATGYFRTKAADVGASAESLEHYYDVTWERLIQQTPEVEELFPAFLACAPMAEKCFTQKGMIAGLKEYIQNAEAMRAWDHKHDEVTAHLLLLMDKGDNWIASRKGSWRRS